MKLNKHFMFTSKYICDMALNDTKNTIFSFCTLLKLSFGEVYRIFQGDIVQRWKSDFDLRKRDIITYHKKFWHPDMYKNPMLWLRNEFKCCASQIESSPVLSDLIFTRSSKGNRVYYTHTDHHYYSMPETVEHKNIRAKKRFNMGYTPENQSDVVSYLLKNKIFK